MPTTIKMTCLKLNHPEGIEIYGISDLHIGSKEFNESAFQALSRHIMSADNRYVVLTGDYIDNGVKSSVTSPYDATMQPAAQKKYAAEILHPLASRILGGVGGNHEYRSQKDTDSDPAGDIMTKLNLEDRYNESMLYLLINLGERITGNSKAPKYCICLTHGSSGGQTLGAGLSKADQYAAISGADLMIIGHSHKPGTAPASRWECDKGKGVMVQRNYGIMICTAWLDYAGYPARKGLRPLPIAPNHAILNGTEMGIKVEQSIS